MRVHRHDTRAYCNIVIIHMKTLTFDQIDELFNTRTDDTCYDDDFKPSDEIYELTDHIEFYKTHFNITVDYDNRTMTYDETRIPQFQQFANDFFTLLSETDRTAIDQTTLVAQYANLHEYFSDSTFDELTNAMNVIQTVIE